MRMKNKTVMCIFIVVYLIWLFILPKNKNKKSKIFATKIYRHFNAQTCNHLNLQNTFQTAKNVSEIDLEFNYDYKTLLKCFNLDENRFFHMPFVSYIIFKRWIFQGFADHIYSSNIQTINSENVQCGDIIYVKTDFINDFIENYHRKINNPYILITHQSDFSVGYPRQLNFLNDPKVIMWFGQNVIAKHPKLQPLPIGIVPPFNKNFSIFYKMANKLKPFYSRSTLLYLNFASETNNNRSKVLKYFKSTLKNNENVLFNEKRIEWENYLSNLKNSKFVLSPPGNGIDTHRTWESIAMGAIPIVLKSELQPLYDDMPVMVVNNWKEVTEKSMEKFTDENLTNFSKDGIQWRSKLWLRYWITKIMEERNNYVKHFC